MKVINVILCYNVHPYKVRVVWICTLDVVFSQISQVLKSLLVLIPLFLFFKHENLRWGHLEKKPPFLMRNTNISWNSAKAWVLRPWSAQRGFFLYFPSSSVTSSVVYSSFSRLSFCFIITSSRSELAPLRVKEEISNDPSSSLMIQCDPNIKATKFLHTFDNYIYAVDGVGLTTVTDNNIVIIVAQFTFVVKCNSWETHSSSSITAINPFGSHQTWLFHVLCRLSALEFLRKKTIKTILLWTIALVNNWSKVIN